MADSHPKSFWERQLDRIERAGNRLPHPLTLFFFLAAGMLPLSFILHQIGVSVVHPRTSEVLEVNNLLSAEGIQRILSEAVGNFTGFAPLGTVLVAMIGIGLFERSGCITALLKLLVRLVGQRFITPGLVFAGILSSMTIDAGFIILPPLGALIFASLGRHPLAGLCAVVAGASGAYSANLAITALDPVLAGLTQSAAQIYDPEYTVTPLANYYLMVVATFILVPTGWLITAKIVEPRLGKWDPSLAQSEEIDHSLNGDVSKLERKALAWAGLTGLFCLSVCALLVIPENAPLRDSGGPMGGLAPFYQSIVVLLALCLFFPGLVYGLITKSIRSDHDVAKMLADTMSTMSAYIVLAFAAAQFIAYFDWSNLGIIIAIQGAEGLRALNISGFPLLLGVILMAGLVNLFVGSATAKWGILAAVLVPLMMDLGYSPELTQAAYRIGDSVTNIITPVFPYFPIILAFAIRYDRTLGIGSIIAAMLPYSLGFSLVWTALLGVWFFFGWPIGPNAPLIYAP